MNLLEGIPMEEQKSPRFVQIAGLLAFLPA